MAYLLPDENELYSLLRRPGYPRIDDKAIHLVYNIVVEVGRQVRIKQDFASILGPFLAQWIYNLSSLPPIENISVHGLLLALALAIVNVAASITRSEGRGIIAAEDVIEGILSEPEMRYSLLGRYAHTSP